MNSQRLKKRSGNEGGFTLPELLIVLVVGGIVIAAISQGIFLFLKTDGAAADRLARSHDRQQVVQYFSADARSATSVAASLSTGTCSGQSADIELMWSEKVDPSGSTVQYVTDYGRGASTALTRWYCVNGVLKEKLALARNLTAATTPTPAVVPYLNAMNASLTIVTPEGNAFPITATRASGTPVATPVGKSPTEVTNAWRASSSGSTSAQKGITVP